MHMLFSIVIEKEIDSGTNGTSIGLARWMARNWNMIDIARMGIYRVGTKTCPPYLALPVMNTLDSRWTHCTPN